MQKYSNLCFVIIKSLLLILKHFRFVNINIIIRIFSYIAAKLVTRGGSFLLKLFVKLKLVILHNCSIKQFKIKFNNLS